MNKKVELLAPGGDVESIKAAIVAGADAIYCGLDKFNARQKAANISFENLHGILRLAHENNCQVFLTLNIIILESEIPALFKLLNQLVNTGIDGVIVQDMGLFYLLSHYFPTLDVHASTQVTTHNDGQINFLKKLGVSRVNLSRELNIQEIKSLTHAAHEVNMLSEVFVHGSNCIGFSGLCYFSSVHGGNSGNRGQCGQPCRDQYQTTAAGKDFPLNLKDNSLFSDLPTLVNAGVDSLKVEGRIKKSHYVYTVISAWRKQIQSFIERDTISDNKQELYKVFNRDFSNAYMDGTIGKGMYIDNPRDNAVKYFANIKHYSTDDEIQLVKQELYDSKTKIIKTLSEKISGLSIDRIPLSIEITGEQGGPLKVTIHTPEKLFILHSKSNLIAADKYTIDPASIEKRLKSLNNAQFHLQKIDYSKLNSGLFIPFKELGVIKNRIVFILNDSREFIGPIGKPKLSKSEKQKEKPMISILIASEDDMERLNGTTAKRYYQLPDCINSEYDKLIKLFTDNGDLIPWFPSIIIGEDYAAAVELLKQLYPEQIVTNNTGIAYQACKLAIPWIAGPYINTTNSYSLLCMKEEFNCHGAFISNEINKRQIERIVRPENFKLYYSIYHPILLLFSRQCLFHQTVGCSKEYIDDKCLPKCKKSTSIVNMKGTAFYIDKQKSQYNCMYSGESYLNMDIFDDIPDMFSEYFVDLRDVENRTKMGASYDKAHIIRLFESLLQGQAGARLALEEAIYPTSNTQYVKGL